MFRGALICYEGIQESNDGLQPITPKIHAVVKLTRDHHGKDRIPHGPRGRIPVPVSRRYHPMHACSVALMDLTILICIAPFRILAPVRVQGRAGGPEETG